MNFSAADLVKRSASQILYFELRKLQKEPTIGQIKGDKYANKIAQKEQAPAEKRGIISLKNDLLFFCIDMVKNNTYIEIKMVHDMDDYPEWYLQSSILQSALYCTLLNQVQTLDTPLFRKKEGYPQDIMTIHTNRTFELWFGTDKYQIFSKDIIYKHYFKKLEIVSNALQDKDFNKTRDWDKKFKFKEFNILKPQFTKL